MEILGSSLGRQQSGLLVKKIQFSTSLQRPRTSRKSCLDKRLKSKPIPKLWEEGTDILRPTFIMLLGQKTPVSAYLFEI